MTDPITIVTRFIEAWSRMDPEELASYFAEDGAYHNMPMQSVVGRDNVRKFIAAFLRGWTATQWDILNIMAVGNVVMVERIDRTQTPTGKVDLPCVGVFEMTEGKIRVWRDYFDLGTYRSAMVRPV